VASKGVSNVDWTKNLQKWTEVYFSLYVYSLYVQTYARREDEIGIGKEK